MMELPQEQSAEPLSEDQSSSQLWQERYILARIDQQVIAFPPSWVAEIVVVERSRVLNLPFYDSTVLGVVHHRGSIIPLISLQSQEIKAKPLVNRYKTQETLTVVRLSSSAEQLAGVGLVVEQVLGSASSTPSGDQPPTQELNQAFTMFCPENISPSIWQTQRWYTN